MSKNKNRNKNKGNNRKVQFVNVCLRGLEGEILLAAGRRPAASDKDDDSIYFIAYGQDSCIEMTLKLGEAEDFLDAVSTLVSDVKARPFHGSLAADTRVETSGGELEISIITPDDRTARVVLRDSERDIEVIAAREPLERFLFAVLEGICEDLEEDED